MAKDLFTTLNEIDTLADNLECTIGIIGFVMDAMDAAETSAAKDEFAATVFFRNQFDSFARMVFLLLTQAEGMNKQIKANVGQLWEIRRQQQEVTK